jgi:hypothetical protein
MKTSSFLQLMGSIFLLMAFLHGLRLLLGWEAEINNRTIPRWFSAVGALIAFWLSHTSFRMAKR